MTSSLLPIILLFIFSIQTLALDVETSFAGNAGPKVCLSSPYVIPKFINSVCTHRNLTYVGGLFNRFGLQSANSFAVLSANDTVEHLGYIGADATIENVQKNNNDPTKFGAIITTMACPEEVSER